MEYERDPPWLSPGTGEQTSVPETTEYEWSLTHQMLPWVMLDDAFVPAAASIWAAEAPGVMSTSHRHPWLRSRTPKDMAPYPAVFNPAVSMVI